MSTLTRLAEVADLSAWPGIVIADDESASAGVVLDTASAYVRVQSGNPERWPDTVPPSIKAVTVQVAARAWRNPTCASMLTTGPFTEQFTGAVEEAVFITEAEKTIIAKMIARPRVWTLCTTRDDGDLVNGVYDGFSGETIPSSPYPDAAFLLDGAP